MDFNEFINQQSKQLESGNFNNETEVYKPKHKILRLGNLKDANGNKYTKENALVRILPPVQGSNEFFKAFRTLGINYVKKDGNTDFTMLKLPLQDGSSVLDPYVNTWLQQGVQFSRFPNKPSLRYYIHVIEYFNQNGQLAPNTDEQGNLIIQPMELSNTGYKELLSRLSDGMLKPSPNAQHSFISENEAFIVNIAKAKKGEMSWKVNVYPNAPLGALPQGWENQLSDLEKLAQPIEEQNPSFVNWLINNVNNTEVSHDNFKFNRDTNTLGDEPTPQQTEPTQQDVDSQLPGNMGGNQQVGNGYTPENTQAPNVDWDNLAQQQSQPAQQQPQQNTNPWENFDASAVDDSQVPFNTQEQQSQPQPKQQNNQGSQQPQQSVQNQPASVDDVLAGLDLDNL